jgi:hypothetical protein
MSVAKLRRLMKGEGGAGEEAIERHERVALGILRLLIERNVIER